MSEDRIHLDDVIFTKLSMGELNSNYFKSGAGLTAGQDADDYLVYNSTTGTLYYDADGSGASVSFVTLSASLTLTNANFTVI